MTEETITIKSIETKQTKAGASMWTITTNSGKMSIFDPILAEKIMPLVNQNVVVDVETKNNYKNITKIIGTSQIAQAVTQPVGEKKNMVASMCIAYAKDLCVAGKIEVADLSVKAKELLALYEEMSA